MTVYRRFAEHLSSALGLEHEPVAVSFHARDWENGAVTSMPAGCCFWVPAEKNALVTHADDHAGCSVGSYVHGLTSLSQAGRAADVAALVAGAWVTPADLASIPTLTWAPKSIVYEPLCSAQWADVVLLRVSPRSLMTLQGAVPDLRLVAKPQCQIVALAAAGAVVVSPGCAVSRVRTGLPEGELTVALPADELENIVAALLVSRRADEAVSKYAAAALG